MSGHGQGPFYRVPCAREMLSFEGLPIGMRQQFAELWDAAQHLEICIKGGATSEQIEEAINELRLALDLTHPIIWPMREDG